MLRGYPTTRVDASAANSRRVVLSAAEREQAAILIVERGGRYFWASRGDREVVRTTSGIFHLFIDPMSGSTVKVQSGSGQYFETVSTGLTTITYFGKAARLDLSMSW